jgi:hypothetical protein
MCQQLLRANVAEDRGNGQQPGLPALWVEVMFDMLAMIVRFLMLADQIVGQRSAAPLAAMRLSVHSGKGSLEILRRHVVSPRQATIGQ